jgi:hypothetical protein
MQYLLMIIEDERRFSKGYDPAEMGEYQAFGQEFAGKIKGGNALQASTTASTVRVRNGKPLTTDGPYAEAKEHIGGFYLVDVASKEEAVAMAAKIPAARHGGVEVRPIQTFQ